MTTHQVHIIPHPQNDHRAINVTEIMNHEWYSARTSRDFPSSIRNYINRDGPNFFRSTSKWHESHLNAFKVIFLDDLPVSRIIPHSILPSDHEPVMKYAKEEFQAPEESIRKNTYGLSLATSFYSQLSKVLRRPGSPILSTPLSQNLRPQTQISTTQLVATRTSMDMSTDSTYHPSTSSEAQSSRAENIQGSSDEDKAEVANNQMAVTLLDTLCTVYNAFHLDGQHRISFGYSAIPTLTNGQSRGRATGNHVRRHRYQ